MKRIKDFIFKHKYPIFFFFCAFLILLFTSKNSFLFKLNDWVDANAFYTVGKGMMNGVIPYRDLFEQKGPLLYVIYGIGYLFSPTTFHGVFILEVLFFTVFLYYIHKIICMFLENKKYSLIIVPIFAVLLTTCFSFTHGGSCEEFCLPFMAISLYYFIRHFKEKPLTNKEIYLNGLMAGLVLIMKFTILGFWIGFGFFMFLDFILKKKYKEAFLFCIKFLIGMAIPFLIVVIFFLITGGLKDFFENYFIINMTAYPSKGSYGLFGKLYRIARSAFTLTKRNLPVMGSLLFITPVLTWFVKDKNNYLKISLIGLMASTYFFIFFGLKYYVYYLIPCTIFIIFALIGLFSIFKNKIDKIINKKYMYVVFGLILITSTVLSFVFSQSRKDLFRSKEDYFQFKYAEYINKYENATLVNMGSLDVGLYTTTGIIPTTYYFEVQNFDYDLYPYNIDELKRYAREKETMFIVYSSKDPRVPKEITDNYNKVYADEYRFEGSKRYAYLYQAK